MVFGSLFSSTVFLIAIVEIPPVFFNILLRHFLKQMIYFFKILFLLRETWDFIWRIIKSFLRAYRMLWKTGPI